MRVANAFIRTKNLQYMTPYEVLHRERARFVLGTGKSTV